MWNSEAVSIPIGSDAGATFTLLQDIPGMQLVAVSDGSVRLGPISKLPKGGLVESFGAGFNERTLKVRFGSAYYFVFVCDVDSKTESATTGE